MKLHQPQMNSVEKKIQYYTEHKIIYSKINLYMFQFKFDGNKNGNNYVNYNNIVFISKLNLFCYKLRHLSKQYMCC